VQLTDRIGRRIKLQDLHVLMTVVQAGSMGKAAERLNTTQPNVSRSIAELENAVGVRLLDRHRQGIEPTEYGRALLACGVAAFDELRQGVKNIEFLADPAAGEVRIGSSFFLAPSFVSAVIDRLSLRYPRMVFHLHAMQTDILQRELSERNVDLVITQYFAPVTDERLSFETLFDDSYVVVVGAKNPWVQRGRIHLAELVNESWLLPPPESLFGLIFRKAFAAAGADYPRATVVNIAPDARISLLETGRFLTILPTNSLKFPSKRRELKVLPVELAIAPLPHGVLTLKNRTLSPAAQLFIDCAREVAKPLTKNDG
jgi:DNA-binding transcriptional LysR family regulator